jgi:hypothetical protein
MISRLTYQKTNLSIEQQAKARLDFELNHHYSCVIYISVNILFFVNSFELISMSSSFGLLRNLHSCCPCKALLSEHVFNTEAAVDFITKLPKEKRDRRKIKKQ